MCSVKGFSTVEATARSLLREDKIGKQHEEDADDEADVEVDRRPALHAHPRRVSSIEAAQRCYLPQLPVVVVVVEVWR